jgi:hypothetical protein
VSTEVWAIGGLYALERLGQNTPDHRQVVVDVLCAYLRTPPPSPETRTGQSPGDGDAAASAAQSDRTSAEPGAGVDPREEHQVRLTAERILAGHLRDPRPADQRTDTPSGPRFWDGMTLDLTAATLTDFDLTRCHAHHAWFGGATFTGVTWFGGATFTGVADFDGVTFIGVANFDGATFTGVADFDGATFTGKVWGLLESDRFGGWTLRPVPGRPHVRELVPPDPVPVTARGGPGVPAEPDGAPAESAFDAAPDGQDGEAAQQDGTEEPQGDLEYPRPEGERHGLGRAEQ